MCRYYVYPRSALKKIFNTKPVCLSVVHTILGTTNLVAVFTALNNVRFHAVCRSFFSMIYICGNPANFLRFQLLEVSPQASSTATCQLFPKYVTLQCNPTLSNLAWRRHLFLFVVCGQMLTVDCWRQIGSEPLHVFRRGLSGRAWTRSSVLPNSIEIFYLCCLCYPFQPSNRVLRWDRIHNYICNGIIMPNLLVSLNWHSLWHVRHVWDQGDPANFAGDLRRRYWAEEQSVPGGGSMPMPA